MNDEIMTKDVNDTAEQVQLLANTLAACALELYDLAEDDISLELETEDGRRIEVAVRGVGGGGND